MTAKSIVGAVVGPNVDNVDPGTSTAGAGAVFPLGMVVTDNIGNQYMYVQAGSSAISTTLNEPYAVAITSAYVAALITTALAAAGDFLGFAPRQVIAAYSFFWARIKGVVTVRTIASAGAGASLRTTTTAGRLGTTSTASAWAFAGVVITAAASASSSASNTIRTAILTNPVRLGKLSGTN